MRPGRAPFLRGTGRHRREAAAQSGARLEYEELREGPFPLACRAYWSRRAESNRRPAAYKAAALPAELHRPSTREEYPVYLVAAMTETAGRRRASGPIVHVDLSASPRFVTDRLASWASAMRLPGVRPARHESAGCAAWLPSAYRSRCSPLSRGRSLARARRSQRPPTRERRPRRPKSRLSRAS